MLSSEHRWDDLVSGCDLHNQGSPLTFLINKDLYARSLTQHGVVQILHAGPHVIFPLPHAI